ncbi:MAG: prepilin-type N-terminal cleavage/methylation domain-containing protein [Archangium sp.]
MKQRGVTMLEAMISMVVAAIGVSGVASLVVTSSAVVRRTQTRQQATEIARRELERIAAMGCNPDPAAWCNNITALDGRTSTVWLSVDSGLQTTAPTGVDSSLRAFRIDVDVDPPYEGAERGSPIIERPLDGATGRGSVVNVRVTVSWTEPKRPRQAAVLQTRMAP